MNICKESKIRTRPQGYSWAVRQANNAIVSNTDEVAYASNPSTLEAEAGGLP